MFITVNKKYEFYFVEETMSTDYQSHIRKVNPVDVVRMTVDMFVLHGE